MAETMGLKNVAFSLGHLQWHGYSHKQIFIVVGTGLFWKRMPSQIFIFKEHKKAPGFKVSKDCLTLLLRCNTEDDTRVKPILIYHSQNP
jgi:hypothetical protein